MSRHTKFVWCILAALLFCAVTYGGCGGGSDLPGTADTSGDTSQLVSGDTSGGDTSQTVSGDTTGGRGDIGDDWEVIPDPYEEFEVFSVFNDLHGSTWSIYDIRIEGLRDDGCIYDTSPIKFSVSNLAADGESATLTASKADYDAPLTATITVNGTSAAVPYIANGKYQRYGTILMSEVVNNSYCMIYLPDNLTGSWDRFTVQNTVYVPALLQGGTFNVITTLVR